MKETERENRENRILNGKRYCCGGHYFIYSEDEQALFCEYGVNKMCHIEQDNDFVYFISDRGRNKDDVFMLYERNKIEPLIDIIEYFLVGDFVHSLS